MKRIAFTLIALAVLADLSPAGTPTKTKPNQVRASRLEIKGGDSPSRGTLYLTVGGKEKKVADAVSKAWLINEGSEVAYSRRKDGAGGFENDGESLRIYDLRTGKTRKVLSEYFAVEAVMETKVSTGENALLIRMSDGASFTSYFAVVNSQRGEFFSVPRRSSLESKATRLRSPFIRTRIGTRSGTNVAGRISNRTR
jgi:hypothetical protein